MAEEKKGSSLVVKLIVGTFVLVLSCCFGTAVLGALGNRGRNESGDRPSIARALAPPTPAVPAGPPIDVDARKLWADYQANEVSADESYKGKPLRVSGTLHSINKDFKDDIYLALQAENPFMSTHAELDASQRATASALKKGQRVTVLCVGGGMVVGSPILKDCTVVP